MSTLFRCLLAAIALHLSIATIAHAETGGDEEAPRAERRGRSHRAVLQGVVNLNTADPATLELLPGIGESKAATIVAFRAKHAFKRIEDLDRVKGFGKKTISKLRPYLAVTGATTLNEGDGEPAREAPAMSLEAPKSARPAPQSKRSQQ